MIRVIIPELVVRVHPLLECLGEELGPRLPDVHGEDDEVEVPLDVVHDLVLEEDLPVVGRDVERHLVLDDDLADVLHAGAAGRRGRQVDQLVHLRAMRSNFSLVKRIYKILS